MATSLLSGPTSLAPGTNSALLRWVLLSKTARSPRADPSHQCSTAKGQTQGQTPGGVPACCHPVGRGPLACLSHASTLGQAGGTQSDIFLWASSLGSDGQRGRALPQCTQLAQGLLSTGCWSCCRSRKQLQAWGGRNAPRPSPQRGTPDGSGHPSPDLGRRRRGGRGPGLC